MNKIIIIIQINIQIEIIIITGIIIINLIPTIIANIITKIIINKIIRGKTMKTIKKNMKTIIGLIIIIRIRIILNNSRKDMIRKMTKPTYQRKNMSSNNNSKLNKNKINQNKIPK